MKRIYSTLQCAVCLASIAIFLSACGGGGNSGSYGSSGTPPPSAPSALQYAAPPSFTVGQAISPLTPTVSGQVNGYSISPALPAGLAFDTTSGTISGTPTAITAAATYTVSAGNAGGNTTTTVSIVVNDKPPTIAYASPYYAFTTNANAAVITPAAGGGAITTKWSVTPALPAGLTLDTSQGTISGTPTAASAATSYQITAGNSGGNGTATLTLAVAGAPLLDLGHAAPVVLMRTDGTNVLSLDATGHWLLEGYASATTLASGNDACGANPCTPDSWGQFPYPPVDLQGATVIDPTGTSLEIRSAADGHVLATIPGPFSWYRLASDGSYVATGTAQSLTAWTLAGQTLFTQAGDYSKAIVFCAPTQVQVAGGPAGAAVIETISTGGTSSTGPAFQGQFAAWFGDGARFLTQQSSTVWTYSAASAQQDVTQLPADTEPYHVQGQGNWLWMFDGSLLRIYKVGASTSPALTVNPGVDSLAIPSGNTIGVLPYGTPQVTVVDLSGTTPASTSYAAPIAYLSSYGAAPNGGTWLAANRHGVVVDGANITTQPRYLTLGAAFSIAGGTQYFSVATSSGKIFTFNAATNSPAGTLDFSASQLASSADGTVLAAAQNNADAQYEPGQTLNIYSLPSGQVTNSFTYAFVPNALGWAMSLSASGAELGTSLMNSSGCTVQVVNTTGGAQILCDTYSTDSLVLLSPDGAAIATTTLMPPNSGNPSSLGSTQFYKVTSGTATLAGSAQAWAVGWLDSGHLLAQRFTNSSPMIVTYQDTSIFDTSGNLVSTTMLPNLGPLAAVSATSVYSAKANAIYSVTDGTPVWMSADPALGMGAVAGSQVVFASGNLILAQPH